MALKRINKELTDLGRYELVLIPRLPLLHPPPLRSVGCRVGKGGVGGWLNWPAKDCS